MSKLAIFSTDINGQVHYHGYREANKIEKFKIMVHHLYMIDHELSNKACEFIADMDLNTLFELGFYDMSGAAINEFVKNEEDNYRATFGIPE